MPGVGGPDIMLHFPEQEWGKRMRGWEKRKGYDGGLDDVSQRRVSDG